MMKTQFLADSTPGDRGTFEKRALRNPREEGEKERLVGVRGKGV